MGTLADFKLRQDEILDDLEKLDRTRDVLGQKVTLQTHWWTTQLGRLAWDARGELGSGQAEIELSRADLFQMGEQIRGGELDARDFVAHVLLWGSGSSRRNNRARLDGLFDPAAQGDLQAALLTRDREKDFAAFRPSGRNRFKYLGPAFFSKLMYFSGVGAEEGAALIVDSRVLKALAVTEHGTSLPVQHNYGISTYLRACEALESIASLARASGRPALTGCTADMVERWAFGKGADL